MCDARDRSVSLPNDSFSCLSSEIHLMPAELPEGQDQSVLPSTFLDDPSRMTGSIRLSFRLDPGRLPPRIMACMSSWLPGAPFLASSPSRSGEGGQGPRPRPVIGNFGLPICNEASLSFIARLNRLARI
jgi:hypothetical protein